MKNRIPKWNQPLRISKHARSCSIRVLPPLIAAVLLCTNYLQAQTAMNGLELRSPFHTDDALILYIGLKQGPAWSDLSRNKLAINNQNVAWMPDQSLSFNGTNAWLEIPHQTLISPEKFTLALWINPATWTNNTTVSLISKKIATTGYLFYYTGNELYIHAGNNGKLWNTGLAIPTGVWSHLAYTYDAQNSTKYVYLNGVPVISSTLGNNPTCTEPLRIGRNSGVTDPQFFCGRMADFAFFSRILSSQEVARIYQAGLRTHP